MRLRLVALSAIILAACGSQRTHQIGVSTASPTDLQSPKTGQTPSPVLFAVLETRRAGAQESEYAGSHDTIAIAGLDGYARAKTTFTPRSIPQIGMAAPVLQPEAYVAAGGVYFIDGNGLVRRLDSSGAVRKVTGFPITSAQQAVSLVVSPDGKQLMATILTYPTPVPNPSPNSGPPFTLSGSWALDIQSANDGGSATVVRHWQSQPEDYPGTAKGFRNLVVAGWDSQGPLAMVDGYNGAQQVLVDGQRWAGGHLVRLGFDGVIGADAGPANCSADWLDDRGNVICTRTGSSPGRVEVGTLDGRVVFSRAIDYNQQAMPGGYALSPDGQRLAMNGRMANRNGPNIALPANFLTRGWLDDQTIIGIIGTSKNLIGVIHLGTSQSEDWGFSGQFVGVIR